MFIVPCFGFGGLEKVVLSIVKNIDRSRFNPSFCTLLLPEPELMKELEQYDLPCYVLQKRDGPDISILFKLRKLLAAEKVQLVNSHDIGATLYAAPAARLAGAGRVIHTDHSQILAKHKHLGVYRWILKNLVSHSITVSKDLESYLTKEMGVHPGRITTIPNGIDIELFAAERDLSYLYKEFDIEPNDKVVGSIGRLKKQKGMEYLISAFKIVVEAMPQAKLFIVGDGELRQKLESIRDELGIEDNVIFTGIRNDIPALLQFFDLFTLASLWEGQPLTIMEAMAAGKPIIATDVGGNAEILKGGDLGTIVPPRDSAAHADSILTLLKDESRAEELGKKARAFAQRELGDTPMARKYDDLFYSIMSS
jgi:glycosyltransferase involved in cell wall biosynthesis